MYNESDTPSTPSTPSTHIAPVTLSSEDTPTEEVSGLIQPIGRKTPRERQRSKS